MTHKRVRLGIISEQVSGLSRNEQARLLTIHFPYTTITPQLVSSYCRVGKCILVVVCEVSLEGTSEQIETEQTSNLAGNFSCTASS